MLKKCVPSPYCACFATLGPPMQACPSVPDATTHVQVAHVFWPGMLGRTARGSTNVRSTIKLAHFCLPGELTGSQRALHLRPALAS